MAFSGPRLSNSRSILLGVANVVKAWFYNKNMTESNFFLEYSSKQSRNTKTEKNKTKNKKKLAI